MSEGDVLATAELTYPGLPSVVRMLAIRTRGIAVDGEGIVPEALDAACHSNRITALHLWVHLPDPQRTDECVTQARQRGVLIAGAEAFAVGRDVPPAVRVCIAQVPHREDVRRGLEILRKIFAGCSDPLVQIL